MEWTKAKPPIAFLAIGGIFNLFLNQSDGFKYGNAGENSCKVNIRTNREGGMGIACSGLFAFSIIAGLNKAW